MPQEKNHLICPEIRQRARELRKSPTPPEKRLWSILRNRNLGGFKFRRQHPIGTFIVDFYCAEVNLVVEIDGSVHPNQEEYDTYRTMWLESKGLTVIRFWNHDVTKNLNQVTSDILHVCERLKCEEEHAV